MPAPLAMTYSSSLPMVKTIRRLEDGPLLVGAGSYVGDLVDSETLHCAFVRSPIAHGTFDPPSLEEAAAQPGVVAVYDAGDLALPDIPSRPMGNISQTPGMDRPPLARDRVRFVGEAVAVVVAETARQAVDAAELVWVDYDPLPAVVDPLEALAEETFLFPDAGSNLVLRDTVVTPGERPPAEVEVEVRVDIPRLSSVTIEPLAILVRPRPDGLDIWCGQQSPTRLQAPMESLLGLAPGEIRVRVPDVGGAFGAKNQLYPEYAVVTSVAHRLGRPVAWLQRRGEQLLTGTHGRSQTITIRLGADSDGRIRSMTFETVADVGAYPASGRLVPISTRFVSPGLYDIEHLDLTATVVATNKAPTGPYRGAGRPEAAIAIERAVDALAAKLEMRPEEVRLRNYIPAKALPFTTGTGAVYDSGDYAAALRLALDVIDVDRWRAEQADRRRSGGHPIGIGLGTFIERAGGALGTGEYGKTELRDDGSLVVRTGSTPSGQGHRTVWSQIAAGVFSLSPDEIVFHAGDTAEVADSVGTFGSRSTQLGGSAILRTATEVRERARDVAAEMLEASSSDVELVDGQFRVVGSPGSELSLSAVATRATELGIDLSAEEMFNPNAQTFPYGAHVAVVEVELETGEVRLLRLVAVDDCGNVINPMVVEGQVHGSIMQGIGEALLESVVYDEDGQPRTTSLMDYLIPTATQEVSLETRRLVSPAPSNPLGAKGSGEAGCIGTPPAILNAVHDALRPLGVTSIDLPLTPARVWETIHGLPSS